MSLTPTVTRLLGAVITLAALLAGATPAMGTDYFLYPGTTLTSDVETILTTGDRVITQDPNTGEFLDVRTITTTPLERATEASAADDERKVANGPHVVQMVTYSRNSRKRDKGRITLPTIILLGCTTVNDADVFTWRSSGGTYRTVPVNDNGVIRGDGRKRVNHTATFTTNTDNFNLLYAKTKAKIPPGNLQQRQQWLVWYSATRGAFRCT